MKRGAVVAAVIVAATLGYLAGVDREPVERVEVVERVQTVTVPGPERVERVEVPGPVEYVERVEYVEVPADTITCDGGFVAHDVTERGEWAYCEPGERPAIAQP